MQKQANEANKVVEKKVDRSRIKELAKPKDPWKVYKKLQALQKQFPHDRVLERMLKEEGAKIKALRRPEEYDVYDLEKD